MIIHRFGFRFLLLTILIFIIGFPASVAMAFADGPNNPVLGENVSTVGTEPWDAPDEITLPGSPYSTVNLYQRHTISNYLQGTQYGFNLPLDTVVVGVEVRVNRMSSGHNPSIHDYAVNLVKNGIVVGEDRSSDDSWPTSLAVATYGGPNDLWGVEWAPADINSPDFGAAVATYRDNNGNNNRYATVDSLRIRVYYAYATTTTVQCGDGSPVMYGDSVVCVATVSRVTTDFTPTGSVNWSSDVDGVFEPNPCTLDGADGVATCTATYTPTNVGSGNHTITAEYAGDDFFAPSDGEDNVPVAQRPLTVTADPQTKVYGDNDPEFTYQITEGSLVFNDNFTGTLSREPGEDVGEYEILQGTLELSQSYLLSFVGNTFTITKAEATCTVAPYNEVFSGNPYTAIGACTGVLAEPLDGLDVSATTHTNAGIYIDSWFFTDLTGNYNDQDGEIQDEIDQADALCLVVPYDVVYDGDEHQADGSCVGVLSEPLLGLDLSATAHTDAGTYTDPWTFVNETGNYHDQGGEVEDIIDKAVAVCDVTPYLVTYNGLEHLAGGTCTGVLSEPLDGLDLSGTAHTDAGVFIDPWVFTDVTGNYLDQNGTTNDTINKADPTCDVTPYILEYDRNEHSATGSCVGVLDEPLEGLNLGGTAHTEIGNYLADPWIFTDVSGNYTNTDGTVEDEITLRFVTVVADAQSKVVGRPDPELTYQVTVGSLLSGDAFSGTLAREPGEHVGTYTILQGTLDLPSYYQLTFIGADFRVSGTFFILPLIFR